MNVATSFHSMCICFFFNAMKYVAVPKHTHPPPPLPPHHTAPHHIAGQQNDMCVSETWYVCVEQFALNHRGQLAAPAWACRT